MKNSANIVFGVLVIVFTITGCASSMSSDAYSRNSARRVQTVEEGEVVFVREVMIEGTKSGLGIIGGAIIGRSVGNVIGDGKGKAGRSLARSLGTVGGAAAGAAVEEKSTQQKGLEITIQLDSGEVVAVVQAADVAFNEGDQVRVLRRPNGEARVVQ